MSAHVEPFPSERIVIVALEPNGKTPTEFHWPASILWFTYTWSSRSGRACRDRPLPLAHARKLGLVEKRE